MNFAFTVARRYLLGKKSHTIINIISMVSVAGVAVGTMALIVVLSVFNGFGDLVVSLYDTFDPDIKITPREGKAFSQKDISIHELNKITGIKHVFFTLEENALVKYNDRQYIATIKGVDNNFIPSTGIAKKIVDGSSELQHDGKNFALIGSGVAYSLSMNPETAFLPMAVYVPGKDATNILSPEEAFKQQLIIPGGVFSIQQDFDSKYILVPLSFAKELTNSPDGATAVEVILQNKKDEEQVKEKIKQIAGNKFVVKGRVEQHELLYKILKSEKWAVFLILSFIMVIGIFNILGTLTMLVIEKKRDIQILKNLGAPLETVQRIFFNEGSLITLIGISVGLLSGWIICFAQQTFGLVKLGEADAFLVNAYPVSMQLLDFTYVAATVLLMGAVASWIVARKLVRKYY